MRKFPVPASRALAVAAVALATGLVAGCGSSAPSARPTVTVTVIAPATSPAAPTTSPALAAPQACATATLAVAIGPGSGAAGSSIYPIQFTNTSGSACTLYGYPGVSFITASGSQAGAAATENPVYPRQLVTLAPGDIAHAELKITDAQNYPPSTCDPVTVHSLKVFPPGQTTALDVSLNATTCQNTAVQILAVQTVQPGNGS
jgi:Protein of unknown function (DUF4232)